MATAFLSLMGTKLERLPQKRFNRFYFDKVERLPRYASREVLLSVALYETRNRRPEQIVNLSTNRIRIDATGAIDESLRRESLGLAINRVYSEEQPRPRVGWAEHSSAYAETMARVSGPLNPQRNPQIGVAGRVRARPGTVE